MKPSHPPQKMCWIKVPTIQQHKKLCVSKLSSPPFMVPIPSASWVLVTLNTFTWYFGAHLHQATAHRMSEVRHGFVNDSIHFRPTFASARSSDTSHASSDGNDEIEVLHLSSWGEEEKGPLGCFRVVHGSPKPAFLIIFGGFYSKPTFFEVSYGKWLGFNGI